MAELNKTKRTKKELLAALEKSLGIVTSACKQVGVSRTTYYDYYNNDEEFRKQVDDVHEIEVDFAESKLHEKIRDGSDTAIIFFLKTKGKSGDTLRNNTLNLKTQMII